MTLLSSQANQSIVWLYKFKWCIFVISNTIFFYHYIPNKMNSYKLFEYFSASILIIFECNIIMDVKGKRQTPWVSRNSCTWWVPRCDVTNEGLSLKTIAGCRINNEHLWVWTTTTWDPSGAGISTNSWCKEVQMVMLVGGKFLLWLEPRVFAKLLYRYRITKAAWINFLHTSK